MIPGISRSGATIMGALTLGVERRTAAEFSFFLAIPTMLGATTLELLKNGDKLTSATVGWGSIVLGFIVSFIVALLVIRWFVGLVSRSEEHTSELQSLMRISYDVFFLKKKNSQHVTHYVNHDLLFT